MHMENKNSFNYFRISSQMEINKLFSDEEVHKLHKNEQPFSDK